MYKRKYVLRKGRKNNLKRTYLGQDWITRMVV